MKKNFLAVLAVGTLAFAPLAAADQIDDLKAGLQSFVDNTPGALPFAASQGLDWSNAYIGNLIDTDFPFVHLGVGVSGGLSSLPEDSIAPLLNALDVGVDPANVSLLPFVVANARLGGLVLPFDVGLKVGFLPEAFGTFHPDNGTLTLTYQNIGFDVRYNLVKSDLLLPDVSVGAGFSALKAGLSYQAKTDDVVLDNQAGSTLTIETPKIALDLNATTFELKAQVSKTLIGILTPYVGASALFGSAGAEAGVTSDITPAGAWTLSDWEDALGVPVKSSGFGIDNSTGTFGAKVYGGASLNILIVKIDGQLALNLTDGSVGATIGARIQL